MSKSFSNKPTVRPDTVCIRHQLPPEELQDYESHSGRQFVGGIFFIRFLIPIVVFGSGALGESVTLAWRFHGSPKRLRTLAINARGIERASIPGIEGDTEYVNTFEEFRILSTADRDEIANGKVQFVPEKALPSLHGANNQIIWRFELDACSYLLPDARAILEFKVAAYSISDADCATKGSFDLSPSFAHRLKFDRKKRSSWHPGSGYDVRRPIGLPGRDIRIPTL